MFLHPMCRLVRKSLPHGTLQAKFLHHSGWLPKRKSCWTGLLQGTTTFWEFPEELRGGMEEHTALELCCFVVAIVGHGTLPWLEPSYIQQNHTESDFDFAINVALVCVINLISWSIISSLLLRRSCLHHSPDTSVSVCGMFSSPSILLTSFQNLTVFNI